MTENFTDYRADQLPKVVLAYLDASDEHRRADAASYFATDATVLDDGKTYEGIEAIRAWLLDASSEYIYTSTRIGQQVTDEAHSTVKIRLDGNFPGGTVILRFQFEIADGSIRRLAIEV
jgi:cell division FtsZ-interacting protein ZapD